MSPLAAASSSVSVRVRVPATSANLGPGFDALGLALGLHDMVDVRAEFGPVAPGGPSSGAAAPAPAVTVTVDGYGAQDVPRDESHLVVRAMRAGFAEAGVTPTRLELTCRNAVPHGRGLGSSASAIVAGTLAARELAAQAPGGTKLSDDAVFDLACRVEGHPDNVAPCLFGGFTIAWTGPSGVARVTRMDVHPDIRPVACVAPAPLATETARGLLPETVPHADAAWNAGRAALLVEAMTRRPDLLFDATEDRLHQPYRKPAMPASIALIEALRQQGLPAVVSGAGPTVLVLASADDLERVRRSAPDWEVMELGVDAAGATAEASPIAAVLDGG